MSDTPEGNLCGEDACSEYRDELECRVHELEETMVKRMGTVEELYNQAMTVERPREARAIFSSLVLYAMRGDGMSKETAEEQVKAHLGYHAAYHSHATRRRVETLFQCVHPYLGPARKHPPEPEDCFAAEQRAAEHGRPEYHQPNYTDEQTHSLLLENVYQFREMLDAAYDREAGLQNRLEALKDAAQKIESLKEENLKLRVTLKTLRQRADFVNFETGG